MKLKTNNFLSVFIVIFLLSITFVSAQNDWWSGSGSELNSGSGEKIVSGITNPIQIAINTLLKLADATVNLPRGGQTSALGLLLTFILLFAMIYPASGLIPPFKNATSQGPRKAFAIAFAILTVFFSPIAIYVYEFIRVYLSSLVAFGLFVLFILIFWYIIRYSGRGFAEANKVGAGTAKINLESKKINDQVNKERKIIGRENTAIKELEHLTHEEKYSDRMEEEKWEHLLHSMSKIESITSPAGMKIRDQLIAEATVLMRRENKQDAINERLLHLLPTDSNDLARIERLMNSNLKSLAQKLHNKNLPNIHDINHAERLIKNAKENAAIMRNLYHRLKHFALEERRYDSKVEHYTKEVIASLRNNNVHYASNYVKEIIKEIKIEERLLNEVLYTERKLLNLDHSLFNEIKKLV